MTKSAHPECETQNRIVTFFRTFPNLHTQGSGKYLTMVWLTKRILENITGARVLIITDREELDDQIEKIFCCN